ncbi:hypothetical protein C8D89_13018 [Actinomycetospora cinnamomea]|uniref:Replication protein n=2 Tax=Actinomycetospora cinnamomea TaxID=663609 RepID=A0A2U1E8V1_9PSEU|nr:hypothetical protein C8D89_13018 [Actinomycetospora cinnamomea]
MAAVRLMGGCAYLVTLTVRHHKGHRLAELWDAVTKGWSAVVGGGKLYADAPGLLGWCRVVEATQTPRSGWHLHVHALWCWSGDIDDTEAQRVAFRAWARWDRALRRSGFDSTPVRGIDARRVRFAADGSDDAVGGYFTKWSTAPSQVGRRRIGSPYTGTRGVRGSAGHLQGRWAKWVKANGSVLASPSAASGSTVSVRTSTTS